MGSKPTQRADDIRERKQLNLEIRFSLRELNTQLSLLNHEVGTHLALSDVDFGCLNLIASHGPMRPSAVARLAGLHPATMTGVLDRLDQAGWIVRERDHSDRRAVVVTARRDRHGDVVRLYSGMSISMNKICAGYENSELQLLATFLSRAADAGREASDELAKASRRQPPGDGTAPG